MVNTTVSDARTIVAIVAVSAGRGRSAAPAARRLIEHGSEVLPSHLLSRDVDSWMSDDRSLAFLSWTLEGGSSGVATSSPSAWAMGASGAADVASLARRFSHAGSLDGLRRFRNSLVSEPGSWAFLSADARTRSVLGVTTSTAVDPIYVAESDGVTVVGTRAVLVHLAIADSFPSFDPAAIATFVNSGYFAAGTPFEGVERIPASSFVEVIAGRSRTGRLPSADDAGVRPIDDELIDEAADAFIDGFRFARSAGTVTTGLTGGKDSRLIIAGLKAAGVDLIAETHSYGDANASDVHVAEMVARQLGVEHRISAVQDEARTSDNHVMVDVDLERRTRDCLALSDGMLTTYENVGYLPSARPQTVSLGGHGGELLRAGVALAVRAPHADHYRSHVAHNLSPYRDLLLPEPAEFVDATLNNFFERNAARHPTDVLTQFHLDYKVGRWSSAARTAYLITKTIVQPLFDNHLTRIALSSNVDDRLNDRLVHGILSRLDPALVQLPFANDYWRFESRAERAAGRLRHPAAHVPRRPRPGRVNLDWRLTYATQLRSEIRDIVFAGGSSAPIFDIVDHARVAELWDGPRLGDPRNRLFAFHLCTAAILLDGGWLRSAGTPGRVIRVDPNDLAGHPTRPAS